MRVRALGVVVALAIAGCGGGGDGGFDTGPPDGAVSPDGGGVDGGPSPDGGPTPDGGETPDGGDGGPAPDGGRDVDAGGPTGPEMRVLLSHVLVERDNELLTELEVRCFPRERDGLPLADPGDLVVEVTASDATEVRPGVFTFPSRGGFEARCASASLGLSGAAPFEVAYEGIDRGAVRLGVEVAAQAGLLAEGIAAVREVDMTAARAKGTALTARASDFDPTPLADRSLLVPFPPGWPTASEAAAAGLGGGADDAAWATALAELRAALAAFVTATAAVPRDAIAPADADGYAAAAERLTSAVADLEALDPSPEAVLANMAALDAAVMEDLPLAVDATSALMGALFEATELPTGGSALTFVGAVISVTWNAIVANYGYGSLLKKMGHVIRDSMAQLVIADLLDELAPPDAGAPQIESVHGSAAGFLTPGQPWYLTGSGFDLNADGNVVIFIHPNVPSLLFDAIDLFDSITSVTDAEHWVQVAKNVYDIIQAIKGLAETAYGVTAPDDVALVPDAVADGFPQIVMFPNAPTKVNCNFVPRTGTLIPVRYGVGRGPTFTVNVIQEGC